MKPSLCLLLAGTLLTSISSASAKIERLVEKTFTVQPGGTLHAQTQGGDIKVQTSADATVKVTAKERIRADTDAEADKILQNLTLTLEQQGNDVSAVAKYADRPEGFRGSWPPVTVDFTITVPERYAAALRTSGGDVAVGDLDGTVDIRTSGGDIKLGRISSAVDARTSGGDVVLAEGRDTVNLDTSGGAIRLGRVVGAAHLRTSGGRIEVKSAESTVDAVTSGGSVKVTFAKPPTGECTLSTSGGSVRVALDAGAKFSLDASAGGGNVRANGFSVALTSGGSGRQRLAGSVNGGGPLLTLKTNGGSVVIEAL